MINAESELWVGRFKQSGDIFVYDPEINSPSAPATVRLFMKDAFVIRDFNQNSIRGKIEREQNETANIIAKSAYRRWQRKQKHRHTHCYCGEALNTVDHNICKECGWIKCKADHCGCTYRGAVNASS
jgi:hypothetical protein